ncbi:uncharacterized protein SPPG_01949 [Spizellomyces punctatus DAOM BR117]|uniref:Uncharacterized protein n=1 Tax=Spizellomyces punctatus (strain DAOM BR117) TaxID=645134 RepID=A0A0L0HPY1_SPIPD|nr:uncharacterized protein SPPG_01949 [Spizellomyces punctatus DAOM BR117]KND02869.1 hypothetical protein SPPG_01949 [Spizellomyces punctatus DAOM BR117]|eukprot:XP_016610908.1 hypothetical protein SPPG_01949 [Spizellomyces punctatus DAOM BR117]
MGLNMVMILSSEAHTKIDKIFSLVGSGTSSPTGSAPPSPPQSPTPADEPDTPDIHPTDSASNAPNGTESILTSHESEAHPTAASDDIRVLKLQLAQAQELVAKQNRQKLRLKSELVAARTELAHIKADMSMAQESVARAAEAEEELAAAKELLVTYKTELNVTQEAHEAAFEYLKRSADRNWIEIEKEISGLYAMLQNPFTPLFVKDDLEGFMPPRQVPRCWDTDSEFDSDVEVDESLAWWRRDAPVEGVKRDPAKLQWWRPDADHPDESEEVESASVSSNESGIPSDVVAHSVVVKAHRKLSDGAVMITDSPSPPLDTPRKRTNSWFRPIQTWVEHLNDIVEDRPVVRVRSRDVYRFDEDLRVDVSGYRGGHPDSAVEVDNVEGPLEKMARGFEGVLEGVVGFGIFKK